MSKNPTFTDIIGEFDGGHFETKALDVLKLVALGVVATGKAGKLKIEIDVKQIGSSSGLSLEHKLSFVKPTLNGKSSEESTTATVMYSDSFGYLSVFPQDQDDIFAKEQSSVKPIRG